MRYILIIISILGFLFSLAFYAFNNVKNNLIVKFTGLDFLNVQTSDGGVINNLKFALNVINNSNLNLSLTEIKARLITSVTGEVLATAQNINDITIKKKSSNILEFQIDNFNFLDYFTQMLINKPIILIIYFKVFGIFTISKSYEIKRIGLDFEINEI